MLFLKDSHTSRKPTNKPKVSKANADNANKRSNNSGGSDMRKYAMQSNEENEKSSHCTIL